MALRGNQGELDEKARKELSGEYSRYLLIEKIGFIPFLMMVIIEEQFLCAKLLVKRLGCEAKTRGRRGC